MARAKRICPKPGCPHVAVGRYCPQHNREYEAKRGSYYQRSGGAEFAAKRKAAARQVEAGGVNCWRCRQPIDQRGELHRVRPCRRGSNGWRLDSERKPGEQHRDRAVW